MSQRSPRSLLAIPARSIHPCDIIYPYQIYLEESRFAPRLSLFSVILRVNSCHTEWRTKFQCDRDLGRSCSSYTAHRAIACLILAPWKNQSWQRPHDESTSATLFAPFFRSCSSPSLEWPKTFPRCKAKVSTRFSCCCERQLPEKAYGGEC